MADHLVYEALLEQLGDELYFVLHDVFCILDQVGLALWAIAGYRRRIPCMKMHSDLTPATLQNVTAKLAESRAFCHLIVSEPGRLKSVPFTKLLKPWQIAGVLSGNGLRQGPQIVSLGINRDPERYFCITHLSLPCY